MRKREISIDELSAAGALTHPPMLIDVREENEYAHERLPGSQCVPLTGLGSWLMSISQDESIVFICQTGVRSLQAATLAATLGYRGAVSLAGGIESWRAHGNPLEGGPTDGEASRS